MPTRRYSKPRITARHGRKGPARSLLGKAVALGLAVVIAVPSAFAVSGGNLLGGIFPAADASTQPTSATPNAEHVADASSANSYLDLLGEASDGGRYAGRVWTDKSVYTDPSVNLDGQTIANDSDFLTVYSALGSTRVINGSASTPLDVVLMLDVSTSMSPYQQGQKPANSANDPIEELTSSANSLIGQLMSMNDENRVGVVSYGGGSAEVMPLDHYAPGNQGPNDYLRLQQNWTNKYYNRLLSRATGVRSGQISTTPSYFYADSTYLQGAIFQGTNMLANEQNTTYVNEIGQIESRIPVIIVLTDGGTNIVSANRTGGGTSAGSYTWDNPFVGIIPRDGGNYWAVPNGNPLYASLSNTLNYGDAIASRSLAVLLGAARQKMLVEDNYSTRAGSSVAMRGYSIGYNIANLGRNETEQLYLTMDPGNYLKADATGPDGSTYAQSRAAYQLYSQYKAGASPSASWTLNGTWVNNSRLSGTWNYTHPSSFDPATLDNLNYVDQFYVSAQGSLDDIFDDIYSQLGGVAFHPVSSGGTAGSSGGIVYTDPIGEYLEIKDFKGLRLFGTTYQVIREGSAPNYTYRVADASGNSNVEVTNLEYVNPTKFKLSDIQISVISAANADTPNASVQTLHVTLPEEALPLRKEIIDLNAERDANGHQTVRSYTSNIGNAPPMRLYYTVGVSDSIKRTGTDEIDISKVSRAYRDKHTNDDGSLDFLSNIYTAEENGGVGIDGTTGNATVAFTPDESNRYYYFQKNRVIYASGTEGTIGGEGSVSSPVTGTLDPNRTYYLVIDFYGPVAGTESGYGYIELVIARTGEELAEAHTYVDSSAIGGAYYSNGNPTEYDGQPATGRVATTKRGGPRLGRLANFARNKTESGTNYTATADFSFAPTYADNPLPDDEHFVVYQGNNGRLRIQDTAMQVTKVVNRATDAQGNELSYVNEPDFNYTAIFASGTTPFANQSIVALEMERTASGQWQFVPDASGPGGLKAQTIVTNASGQATFKLKNGRGLRFTGLPAELAYTVTEGTAVDGVDAGMSNVLGQADPDGYFSFSSVAGDGSADQGNRSIASSTVLGQTVQANYVNRFTKTAVFDAPPLSISKVLQGRDFEPSDTFTFIMTPGEQSAANTPMPTGAHTTETDSGLVYTRVIGPNIASTQLTDDAGQPIASWRSDDPIVFLGDGADADTSITYSEPGTYTYLIREQRPSGGSSIAGITYENTFYRLTVDVSVDAAANALVPKATKIERRDASGEYVPYWTPADGDPALTFTNRYNTDQVNRTFQGRKQLSDGTLANGQFSFTLEALGSHPVVRDDTYGILNDTSTLTEDQKVQWIEEHIGQDGIPGWTEDDALQPMPGNEEPGYTFERTETVTNGAGGIVQFGEAKFDKTLPLTSAENTNLRGVIYKYQVTETQPTVDGSYDGAPLPGGSEGDRHWGPAVRIDHDGDPSTPERWYYKGVIYDDSAKVAYAYAHLDEFTDSTGGTGTRIHVSMLGDMPFNLETGNNYNNIYRSNAELPLLGTKTISGRDFQGADVDAGVPADSFTFHVAGERLSGTNPEGATVPMPSGVDAAGNVTITPSSGSSAEIPFGTIKLSNENAGSVYRYTITESGGILGGVIYDTEPRVIDVTVNDDGYGGLSYVVTDAAGQAVATDPVSTWANRYEPQSIGVNLTGSKTFLGHTLPAGTFGFDVVQADASGTPVEGGMSAHVVNREGEDVSTGDDLAYRGTMELLSASWARFTSAGTYHFLVGESRTANLAGNPAIDFDESQYLITVTVNDDHVGTLHASVTAVQRRADATAAWTAVPAAVDGTYDVSFENVYEGQTMQVLSLRKQFVGATTQGMDPHTFVITASPNDDTSPADGIRLPARTEIENDADGTIQFDPVTFTKEGTYALNVHEKQPTVDGTFEGEPLPGAHKIEVDGTERWHYQGVNYDNHTATSIFSVTRDPATGSLAAVRTSTTTTRVFTNYTNLTVEKRVEGTLSEADADQEFAFTVRAWTAPDVGEDRDNPVTGTFALEVTTSDGDAVAGAQSSVTFEAEPGTTQGVGTFTIKGGQVAQIIGLPTDCGYTIAEELTEEQLEDWTVVEPASGEVSGSLSLGTSSHHVFVNRKGQPVEGEALANLTAEKIVTSAADEESPYELSAGDFSFTLYPMPSNPEGDPVKAPLVATNAADGSVRIMDDVLYTAAGTYVYELVEDSSDPMPDMIYDSARYTVTVTVEPVDDGQLVAMVALAKNGASYEGTTPIFENRYRPGIVSVSIQGTKVLEGRDLESREFEFRLSPVRAMAADLLETASLRHPERSAAGAESKDLQSADPDTDTSTSTADAVPSRHPERCATGVESKDLQAADPDTVTDTTTDVASPPLSDGTSHSVIPSERGESKDLQPADPDTATDTATDAASSSPSDESSHSVIPSERDESKDLQPAGPDSVPSALSAFSKDLVELALGDIPLPGNATELNGERAAFATNQFGDSFAFDAVYFDRPGTYVYRVSELNDGKEHIAYDDGSYLVEVTVTESADRPGSLVASTRIIEPDDAEGIVFTNVYTPDEPTPGEPETPATPDTPGASTPGSGGGFGIFTGDTTNLLPLVIALVAAAVCLGVFAFLRRRRE